MNKSMGLSLGSRPEVEGLTPRCLRVVVLYTKGLKADRLMLPRPESGLMICYLGMFVLLLCGSDGMGAG